MNAPEIAKSVGLSWRVVLRALAALTAFVLLTTGFFGMDYVVFARHSFYSLALPWDARIPLVPAWIWVYLLYYPLFAMPFCSRRVLKNGRVFWAVLGGLLIQFVVAWAFFYFLPTRIIHPAVAGSGASARALRGLYAADDGSCIFPSLHVANTLFISLVCARIFSRKTAAPLFLLTALIAAATVLIKQHVLLDLPGGALLGFAAYWWVTRPALGGAGSAGLGASLLRRRGWGLPSGLFARD